MALFWLRLILVLAAAAEGAEADPYADAARRLAIGARQAGIQSVVIMPFTPLGAPDALGSSLLTERLAARLASKEGVELHDPAQLQEGGGSSRRAPDDPLDPVLDVRLFDGIIRIIEIANMHLEDTPKEADFRGLVAGAVKARQLEAIKQRELKKARAEGRHPETDGVVSGVFGELEDGSVEVHARLASTRSFSIVSSASLRVRKDWGRPAPGVPKDYSGLAALAGTASVGLWFLMRAVNG